MYSDLESLNSLKMRYVNYVVKFECWTFNDLYKKRGFSTQHNIKKQERQMNITDSTGPLLER